MKKLKYGLLAVCGFSIFLTGCDSKNNDQPDTPEPVTTYNVSFNGVKCTSNAQASYNEGQEVNIQITPNEGYAYPLEVYVYGGSYSYNKYDGTLKFTINEDTTIYCASFEKPKYYLSAEYNDEVIHSSSELSEDGKELVSTWYYETVDVRTYSYENGRLTSFKEVEKYNEGDVESNFINYTYENGNIVRVDFPDDEDGTKNFEQREYDQYNRITKSVLMWGEEAYNLTTFEYPDNFTCICKRYFEYYDDETEEYLEDCFTTIKKVAIDIEHNTKRVDYVESYLSSEEEYTGYEIYTFDTGKLIERLYSDWSAYDIFEYNEYGDMISNITSEYDSDTGEWYEDTKVTIEYNEDRSLKHVESASPVDSDIEHGYFVVCDYVCNENGLIVSEIDKSYDDGDNYYTKNATFEYKELKFDLYDDDQEDRTNIIYGRTIGAYDLDFWYGF
ncbi:MAG: hypothetical protein KBS97_00200 [Firmicutes bacterium]|nr:hypothetical protein [Candidatus Fiminaster equi]